MSYIEKERLIRADIESIENRVRHAFNQGYDLGYKEGKERVKAQEQETSGDDVVSRDVVKEQTTKNDLGVCVSRQAVDRLAWKYLKKPTDEHVAFYEHFLELPPITPQNQVYPLCEDCHTKMDEVRRAYDNAMKQEQEPRWISTSEKLPNDRDWYLGIFKEPNTGWINPIPFICDYVGKETKATTKEFWILRGFTDRDEHIDYYFNLECVAWMPFPLRNSIDDLIMREVGNE